MCVSDSTTKFQMSVFINKCIAKPKHFRLSVSIADKTNAAEEIRYGPENGLAWLSVRGRVLNKLDKAPEFYFTSTMVHSPAFFLSVKT